MTFRLWALSRDYGHWTMDYGLWTMDFYVT